MFAKEIGELACSRRSSHIRLGSSQHPLAACVIVLNSGGQLAQYDHVARIARQLLWGELQVDQGRAEAPQPEERLAWVTAGAALVKGFALPFIPRFMPRGACKCKHAIVSVTEQCIFCAPPPWLCPAFQSLPSVEVPPNRFYSFQRYCLILDSFCFWPMIKSCKLPTCVSLCG